MLRGVSGGVIVLLIIIINCLQTIQYNEEFTILGDSNSLDQK